MKSVMHSEVDRTCYLCMALHGDYSEQTVLEEHHAVYGHGTRKLSTKYGLLVYLCPAHHQNSPEAVHHNFKNGTKYGDMIKKDAQRAFIRNYPQHDFLEIFGMNYLTDEEISAAKTQRATHEIAANIQKGFILLGEDDES